MITKELKGTKAITLIAMVISILVLLILAGVSLALVVGETGITQRAVTAKKTYDIAGAKEQVELLVEGYIGDYYGKKYTSGEAVSQDIGTYVAAQLASDTTVGDYTLETSEANVTLKKGEETVAKGKINASGGLDWSNGTEIKVALIKVSDSSSAKDASVGEEVKVGDEHFYVINTDENMLTLLAKYNLATTPNGTTACAFSNSNYWASDWVSGTEMDLNTYEETYDTEMPNTETVGNNAMLRARKYGNDLGATGRLLADEEANSLENSMSTIIYGRYTGGDKVGGSSGNGYLYYWLGSVVNYDSDIVCIAFGIGGFADTCGYSVSTKCSVRPVLEISKDKIE